jgi:hypothetical protein
VESSVGSMPSAPSERHRAAMEDDDFDSPLIPDAVTSRPSEMRGRCLCSQPCMQEAFF